MGARLHLGHGIEALRPSLHNGPGWRVSLWVQGCRLRCTTRCLNPHLLALPSGAGTSTEEILAALDALRLEQPFEGITVLGGEPSEQPEGLESLLRACRERGLTTMVYTGHLLEALRARPGASYWLPWVDLLVDGPFLEECYDEMLSWRGSHNQRIHRLSEAYTEEALETAATFQGKGWSLRISADGRVSLSGLQDRAGAHAAGALLQHLRR